MNQKPLKTMLLPAAVPSVSFQVVSPRFIKIRLVLWALRRSIKGIETTQEDMQEWVLARTCLVQVHAKHGRVR